MTTRRATALAVAVAVLLAGIALVLFGLRSGPGHAPLHIQPAVYHRTAQPVRTT